MSQRDISSRSSSYQDNPVNGNIKKNKTSQDKSGLSKVLFVPVVIITSLILAICLIIGVNDMFAINRQEEKSVTIEIPKDSSAWDIAGILSKNQIIKNRLFFMLYVKLTKSSKNFISGNFEVKMNLDYEAIINYIQKNSNRLDIDISNVTFPEGLNVLGCAEILERNEVCDKDEFLKLCNSDIFDDSYEFLKSIQNKEKRYYKLEGYLFPDTYKFYKNEHAKDVIKRFLNNYKNKIVARKKVEGYDSKVSLEDIAKIKNTSMENVLTIASMVQLEAADEKDRHVVASVFQNRLSTLNKGGVSPFGDSGMGFLRSDVTVFYPYRSKSDVPDDIVDKFKSTYDTYETEGLPPGPVCNPGMDAIEAALNPSDTNYYYFCHSKENKAFYAKTFSQHQRNLVSAGLV